ncbi:MAG: hypothetical protein JSV88_03355 [Candidatus Aminicenantes bacterium]|nr:MAG: hypothetical protein JSV88_03355 [Candidatus Aminicenantes bacterium]
MVMIFSSHLAAYRYFKESNFSEQLLTTFLVYISQITFSVLFLGVVVKNLGILWILLLNGAISFLIIFMLRKTIRESIHQSYKKILNFSSDIFRAKDFLLYLFIFLFVIQIVLLLIKIYYLPPHVWDVFAYHLHPVAEWTQQNMIPSSIDSPVTRMNRNPMGSRLLHFWCLKFTNDIRWIELPQFIYGLLLVLASYSILLKLKVQKNVALRYAILIYFIPLVLIESRTCQDHLVLNSLTLMAALYFINVFYEKRYSSIIFLSLALGLLLGTKISSPQIIFVFFLALLLSKGWNRVQVAGFLNKNKIQILLGLLVILLLGGYWFFKSGLIWRSYLGAARRILSLKFLLIGFLVLVLAFVLGKVSRKFRIRELMKRHRMMVIGIVVIILILGSYVVITHLDLVKTVVLGYKSPAPLLQKPSFYAEYPVLNALKSRFLKNLLVFPFRIKDIGLYTSYTPDFLEKSGFGMQFFGFGLVAYLVIFVYCITRKRYRSNMAGFILIFSIVLLLSYFFYYYSAANYRLFMFFPVFGLIFWAVVTTTFDFPKFSLRIIDGLILVMILFNISTCFFEGNMHEDRWKTLFTIDNPLERTSVKYSHFFKTGAETWEFIDQYMAPGEPLGYMGHLDSWVFPYYDNQLRRRVHYLRSMPGFRLVRIDRKRNRLQFNPRFVESLKRNHIHFIHINPHGARHLRKIKKAIVIDDERVFRVTKDFYYFKW